VFLEQIREDHFAVCHHSFHCFQKNSIRQKYEAGNETITGKLRTTPPKKLNALLCGGAVHWRR